MSLAPVPTGMMLARAGPNRRLMVYPPLSYPQYIRLPTKSTENIIFQGMLERR